jgi:hypothetical protein
MALISSRWLAKGANVCGISGRIHPKVVHGRVTLLSNLGTVSYAEGYVVPFKVAASSFGVETVVESNPVRFTSTKVRSPWHIVPSTMIATDCSLYSA